MTRSQEIRQPSLPGTSTLSVLRAARDVLPAEHYCPYCAVNEVATRPASSLALFELKAACFRLYRTQSLVAIAEGEDGPACIAKVFDHAIERAS